jgi:hypothetical protein
MCMYMHVAPTACMVGRTRNSTDPLGNSTHTIPHKYYSQQKSSGFPVGSCDTAAEDGRRGSNVYEVNQWLWQFGRGKQRLGGLSCEETDDRRAGRPLCRRPLCRRGACAKLRHKADLA